jgi:hypothetical protein
MLNDVFFAQLKIQIHKRHHQQFETDEEEQKKRYVPFENHKPVGMTPQK